MTLDEAALRGLLDSSGVLDPARELVFPRRDEAHVVFSQQPGARIDLAAWSRHAAMFFATRLGLSVDKRYGDDPPARDVARVVLAPAGRAASFEAGARLCWSRPRVDDDLDAAKRATAVGAGLVELAHRCPQVWLVESTGDEDLLALRLAAIMAGVLLGPIVTRGGIAVIGPKSARERLG